MVDYLLKTKLVITSLALLLFLQLQSVSITGTRMCTRGQYLNCLCGKYDSKCLHQKIRLMNCTGDGGLPCSEVWALEAVTSALGLQLKSDVGRDYCSKEMSEDSVRIECNCGYSNNVCHITEITTFLVDLSDGFVHRNISDLTFLERLDLSNNNLHCKIPESLGNLKQLKTLHLYKNFLNGSIPPSLGNLSSLQELRLEENEFTGQLQPELGNLIKLEFLDLSSNYLTGGLPESFHKLKSLTFFGVAGNSLNGTIPKFISKWINLTSLYLLGNDFEEMPNEIFGLSNLQYLWVSNLQKSNFALAKVGMTANLTSISDLILRNCSLTGPIPEWISSGGWLRFLDMSFNNLSGNIPHSLENVTTMLLTGNMLDGPIPSFVTNDSDLSYNNFSTWAPKDHKREKAHVQGPNITPNRTYTTDAKKGCGSKDYYLFINCGGREMPNEGQGHPYDADTAETKFYEGRNWAYSCAGEDRSFQYVDSSSNYLKNKTCGVSDNSLDETARLCPVSLTYYGLCLHKGKYNVKLHFAEIVYIMDEDDSSHSNSYGKRIFDVYIQGDRVLQNFNIKKEAGEPNKLHVRDFVKQVEDDNLLEIRFVWTGKGSVNYDGLSLNGPLVSAISVTPNFTIPGGNKLTTSQIVGITIGCTLSPVLLLVFVWKMGWLGNAELKKVHVQVHGKSFTLKQIIDGTQTFNPKMEIGKGRFGTVYKAELPDQTKIAVKKVSLESTQEKLKDELHGEIFFNMKSFKHENLVQLFGGYSREDLHLLIYEYMENGSLHQVMFGPNSRVQQLNWKVRFEICLGLAKALKYLHEGEGTGQTILHGNIKASNVLLDDNFTAKLTDFGLATLSNKEDPFMTIKVGGARVYIAPEYALGKPITDKADVYSFGVVTLEIFSGKPSVDNKPNQEAIYLIDLARIAHERKNILELLDNKLVIPDRKMALTILKLAILCIHPTADLRPSMSEIVSVLSYEKTIEEVSKVHTS